MKVITGPDTRWSYANVWEPKSINGGTPKYSVSLIIPKSDTKTKQRLHFTRTEPLIDVNRASVSPKQRLCFSCLKIRAFPCTFYLLSYSHSNMFRCPLSTKSPFLLESSVIYFTFVHHQ